MNLYQQIMFILERFRETLDIAWAGRELLFIARIVRKHAEEILARKAEVKRQKQRIRIDRELKYDLQPKNARIPARKPGSEQLEKSVKWVIARLSIRKALEERILLEAKDLYKDIERSYRFIIKLLSKFGVRRIEFSKIARTRSERATVLISILHLHADGRIDIHQDKLYGEIILELRKG